MIHHRIQKKPDRDWTRPGRQFSEYLGDLVSAAKMRKKPLDLTATLSGCREAADQAEAE